MDKIKSFTWFIKYVLALISVFIILVFASELITWSTAATILLVVAIVMIILANVRNDILREEVQELQSELDQIGTLKSTIQKIIDDDKQQ